MSTAYDLGTDYELAVVGFEQRSFFLPLHETAAETLADLNDHFETSYRLLDGEDV